MNKNAWVGSFKKCICRFDLVLSIHRRLGQVCAIQASTCRGLCVGLIVVSSEGMSKVMTFVLLKWPYKLHHSCVLKLILFSLILLNNIISITLKNRWLCIICCYDRPTVTVRCFLSIWLSFFLKAAVQISLFL